jgi:hypothetical protein
MTAFELSTKPVQLQQLLRQQWQQQQWPQPQTRLNHYNLRLLGCQQLHLLQHRKLPSTAFPRQRGSAGVVDESSNHPAQLLLNNLHDYWQEAPSHPHQCRVQYGWHVQHSLTPA